jgi:hypothetical protein
VAGPIYKPTLFEPELIGWSRKWIEIIECDNNIADEIIQSHHYSGKSTTNRFKSFLVNGNQGALQLGYGIRPHMKHTWGEKITHSNSVEFDRMWLSDELPKFSETITISCLIRYLKHKYSHIKYILCYADGSVGNEGIIYQAANFKRVGDIKADFYILESGERVHPVSMWHRHGTRAWEYLQAHYPGIKKAEGRQYRYIYNV